MSLDQVEREILEIESDRTLFTDSQFAHRAEAIDRLEFVVAEQIDGLRSSLSDERRRLDLAERATRVREELEEVDRELFRRLRAEIRDGLCRGSAFRERMALYLGADPRQASHGRGGYDLLDIFVAKLLLHEPAPEAKRIAEPEMVRYQPTPARVILELIELARPSEMDAFFDLGSGLGQVPIMVNLLSGSLSIGVEFEPAFCEYAEERAAELNLSNVRFLNQDARELSYDNGTIYFMYTPFVGELLRQVLSKMRTETADRKIKLLTYGPCTPMVARESWLQTAGGDGYATDRVVRFETLISSSSE